MMVSLKNILRATMVLCSATFFYGCTDEDIISNNPNERLITFTVEDNWTDDVVMAKTRSQQATQRDIFPLVSEDSAQPLYLHTTITDITGVGTNANAVTRATPVEEDAMNEFKVYGYRYTHSTNNKGEDVYTDAGTAPFMENVISRTGTSPNFTWQGEKIYYWPGAEHWFRFFAYTPSDITNLTLEHPDTYMRYEVPDNVAEQKDLMFANTESVVEGNKYIQGNYTGDALPLNFSHILTAVSFTVDNIEFSGTIVSISLKGVRYKGAFDLSQTDPTSLEWTTTGDRKDFTQVINRSIGTQGEPITSQEATFMMMPQSPPQNAHIEMVYRPMGGDDDGSDDIAYRADISKHTWPIGKKVNYKISADAVFFDVGAPDVVNFENTAYDESAKKEYTVKSRRVEGENVVPAKWTCKFFVKNKENNDVEISQPGWLEFKVEGEDFNPELQYENDATYSINVTERTPKTVNQWLAEQTPVGSDGAPYNLSADSTDNSIVTNTSNCYVVNAPGWYSLPLVYGNAIKEGKDNWQAYNPGGGSTNINILGQFYDHTATGITSPWIQHKADGAANYAPVTAELVWMDAKGLIENVALETSDRTVSYTTKEGTAASKAVRFLKFKIANDYNEGTKTGIQQGNAIIAVRGGTADADGNYPILWSWHIWVTDFNPFGDTRNRGYELNTLRSNITNEDYRIMAVNLGWCDNNGDVYSGDEIIIRFIQEVTGETKDVTVQLEKVTEKENSNNGTIVNANSPYYQWGRKDPMLPYAGGVATVKRYYTSVDDFVGQAPKRLTHENWEDGLTNLSLAKNVISKGILKPFIHCRFPQKMDGRFYNLWGANTRSEKQLTNVKTIYDPSPVGYKVPVIDVFASFTSDGKNWESGSSNNTMVGEWDSSRPKGQYIETKEGTVFFPALGYRSAHNTELTLPDDGYYWSAVSANSTATIPYSMNFNITNFNKDGSTSDKYRAYAYSIRPVEE